MEATNLSQLERKGYTEEVIAALGISSLPGIGTNTLRKLGEPSEVIKLFAEDDLDKFHGKLKLSGGKFVALGGFGSFAQIKTRVWQIGQNMASELAAADVYCITPSSEHYPKRLHDLGEQKPNWLFVKGDMELLHLRSVAVVGTRDPSPVGEFLTKTSVSLLKESATPVVSGLAVGIDSIAHEWSLEVDVPTISILGSGILVPYPARNIDLAQRIVSRGGLLVSEYLPRQPPAAETFVWRNRLQACIGDAVVATEWKKSSGTAHTIRFARTLKRTNISLELTGGLLNPEAGRADEHFRLPAELDGFLATLARPRTAKSEAPASQPDLF